MGDFGLIGTSNGDTWIVRERTRLGTPMRVDHEHEWMRRSFLNQWMNAALAVDLAKRELRLALPTWMQRWWPEPTEFWRELPSEAMMQALREKHTEEK